MVYADLHIHTNASDGSLDPEAVLHLAKKQGLNTLSFTDHETISGYHRAHKIAQKLNINLIPGVEMVSSYCNQEIHLIGYNFNPYSELLLSRLRNISRERNMIAKQIIHRLQHFGFNVSWEQVEKLIPIEGVAGKNHILKVLRDSGYIQNRQQTRSFLQQYLNAGGTAYIPYEGNPLSQAISLIHAAGGIAVLAHPGLIGNNVLVESIIKEGIDGLEVFYYYLGDKRSAYIRYYFNLARKYNLLITGGTDFHGVYTPVNLGNMGISQKYVEKLNRYNPFTSKNNAYQNLLKEAPTLS